MPTREEWVDCVTSSGELLDPRVCNGYRERRGLPLLAVPAVTSTGIRKPFKIDRPKQAAPKHLVGDELKSLLKKYGLKPVKSCGCDSWAAKMNEWGIEGCSLHRAEIIAHLNMAYQAATWWDTIRAAGNAVMKDLPLTLGGMVDEAIRRTENPLGN